MMEVGKWESYYLEDVNKWTVSVRIGKKRENMVTVIDWLSLNPFILANQPALSLFQWLILTYRLLQIYELHCIYRREESLKLKISDLKKRVSLKFGSHLSLPYHIVLRREILEVSTLRKQLSIWVQLLWTFSQTISVLLNRQRKAFIFIRIGNYAYLTIKPVRYKNLISQIHLLFNYYPR